MSEHVQDIAQQLHEAYCEATGLKVKYTFSFYSDWYLFAKDYDAEDIKTVVNYLKVLYKGKPEILTACLRITKLIRERDTFGQYLAEAKAVARKPKVTARSEVLNVTGRVDLPPENVQTARDLLDKVLPPGVKRGLEFLKEFKKEQGME